METTGDNAPTQVQVKFVTRHPEITVGTAPILVPSNLKRFGLSQVVNHLLDSSAPIPFDFLVDGAFLRSNLDTYIKENGLSSESILTLEYVRAAVPPKYLSSFQHDDWVSSVSYKPGSDANPLILSGSYDGISRLWDFSGQIVAEAPGHGSSIKSVTWLEDETFLTSSMDRSIRMWKCHKDEEGKVENITCLAEYIGHTSTVDDLAVSPGSTQFLSASSDGTIGIWNSSVSDSPPAPADNAPLRSKKRKLERQDPKVPQLGCLGRLTGHSGPLSAVAFAHNDKTVAYSVSWDHTIRTWDIMTMSSVDTRTTQHPILSLCLLPTLSLIACGSSARHITLHDPRADASGVSSATLRGHTNAVVSLSPSPANEWQMASSSHDGTVRIWDVRASQNGNLFTIPNKTPNTKIFDVEWTPAGIISGGEDKQIHIHAVDV
ncbi:WD40-repeat-containing domain protein [Geopyxis carbonaria]|nr:WD40-repeat-containing domain protein [Geopyxis carbonaria]